MTNFVQRLSTSSTIRTISGLAGSNVLALMVGLVGTLVQARYVGPTDLGYFRTFAIATGYAVLLQMGLDDALQRQFPYYIGRGQREKALAVAEICQAWNIMVTGAVAGAFLLFGALTFCLGNWRAGLGWWAQAVAMAALFYGAYLNATYRSGHDFGRVARSGLLSSVVNLVVLPLFPLFSYLALALRNSLGGLFSLIYLHRHRPLRLPWRFNWKEWRELVREGIPIFTAGYGRTLGCTVAEATLVLHFLGTAALGLWSFSMMALEAANKVPAAITAVYVPRLIEQYGRTHNVRACFALCRVPVVWGAIGMVVFATLCCAVVPFAVHALMPKYSAAVPTMWLMMLALPLVVLELPFSVLVATGRLTQQNVAVYAGMGVFLLLALGAIRQDLGLNGVVGASIAGRITRVGLTYWFLSGACRGSGSPVEEANVKSVLQT